MGVSKPRAGSLQYWPRVRARRMYPVVKSWAQLKTPLLLGFAGYKAGMTHVILKDLRPYSMTKGELVSWPVTVIECPPIRVLSVRFYTKNPYGSQALGEVFASNIEKIVSRKIKLPENYDSKAKLEEFSNKLDGVSDITLKVYTQPKKLGKGKKKPEIFEIALGGSDVKSKLEYAKSLVDRDIHVSDILKAGTKVDIHAVTKGRGFKGTVERYGIALRSHKSEKKRRANIYGSQTPRRILPQTKMPGQLGFHNRTEHNKDIIFVGRDASKIQYRGGFKNYGILKNEYVLIKGSVAGALKRLVRFNLAIRGAKGLGEQLQLVDIDLGVRK